ncbi:class I SAM-dependent methyltransferase [Alkalibacillus aidingensis]|uniref:class I SAM-dependent methyltransferase n=1 Tax=Alkalibacillus aidingensis TaxID=2747607 RepID=UPI001660E51B|nr:class I SAM-dependent methyltransferase [Alkalibacillus aidingensis]
MKQIIPFAHQLLKDSIQPGDTVVDATLGNGHDSLFLSSLVAEHGQVFSFDIQENALNQAKKLLEQHNINQVEMIHRGHEHVYEELSDRNIGGVGGAIFNLGYLPGSDHTITTTADTTIPAINGLLRLLKPERYIILVIYPGHKTGAEEKVELLNYLKTLPANEVDVARYQMVNRSDKAPFVMAIYKK